MRDSPRHFFRRCILQSGNNQAAGLWGCEMQIRISPLARAPYLLLPAHRPTSGQLVAQTLDRERSCSRLIASNHQQTACSIDSLTRATAGAIHFIAYNNRRKKIPCVWLIISRPASMKISLLTLHHQSCRCSGANVDCLHRNGSSSDSYQKRTFCTKSIALTGIFQIGSYTAQLKPFFRQESIFICWPVCMAGGTKLPFRCNSQQQSAPTGLCYHTLQILTPTIYSIYAIRPPQILPRFLCYQN